MTKPDREVFFKQREKIAVRKLKENKWQGISFDFMDEEAKEFALQHITDLMVYKNGKWKNPEECKLKSIDSDTVIALSEEFELPLDKYRGGWIDYEVTCGYFSVSNDRSNCKHAYHWSHFYTAIVEEEFATFGGFQYEPNGRWYMFPVVRLGKNIDTNYSADDTPEPLEPIKIRFWSVTKRYE